MSVSAPDPKYLQALVDSIVETADPERIILFGSAAREQMQDDSDIDLLVVKDRCHRIHTAGRIYAKLPQKNRAVDIVIVWPEELTTYRNAPWGVIPPALREGRTLYAKNAEAPQRPFGSACRWLSGTSVILLPRPAAPPMQPRRRTARRQPR